MDAGDVRPVNEGGYVPAFNLSGAQQPDNTFDPTKSHNIPPDPVRALLWLTPPGPTSLRSLGEQLASAV